MVKKLEMYLTGDSIMDGAVEIARSIRPPWQECRIEVKVYTDGITNRLVGCYVPDKPDDIVLIRVYGEKTELFIDRKIEIRNMQLMHEAGLSPPLLGSFQNGICYGYTPGIVLDLEMVCDERISRLIAEKLAQMHAVGASKASNGSSHGNGDALSARSSTLFKVLRRYLKLMPCALKDALQNER